MCTKGTAARVRLHCRCSLAMSAGALLGLAFVALTLYVEIVTHWVAVLALGVFLVGGTVAGTWAVVRRLMRYTVVAHHHAAQPAPSPAPAKPAPAVSAPDVLAAEAQAYADAAFDARMQP